MNATLTRYGTTLRIYDNGGRSFDRYTVLPPRWAGPDWQVERPGLWDAIGASGRPFHPQGFGQHVSAAPGPHLGKRLHWSALPPDVQRFARQVFGTFAPAALPPGSGEVAACVRLAHAVRLGIEYE